tara:strand:- start:49 stop:1623 length:1575 start_codon:yes stop_codon:yes gene_type:complete
MTDNQLKIKLLVENRKANAQLKQTASNVKDVGDKAKKSEGDLSRMRVATAGLRRSMGALRNNLLLVSFAFGGVGAALAKSVRLYGEQEKAEKQLETALGRTSSALLAQASALQQVTTFGDENIIQAQALIAAFTDDEEAIKKATEATLDLAAAKGMDLFSAADLVAKTLGSSTNAMSRYGIEVTGAVGSTERLNTLTENIAETFGGQATAQAKTMAGAITQAGNAAGDASEAIGNLLADSVTKVSLSFKSAAENATLFFDSLATADEDGKNVSLTAERNAKLFNFFADAIDNVTEKLGSLAISSSYFRKLQEDILNNAVSTESAFADMEAAMQPLIVSEIKRTDVSKDYLTEIKKQEPVLTSASIASAKLTKKELEGYAKTTGSARDAMAAVVKAEYMEGVAGLISSILRNFPFPLSAILAAGAGGIASSIFDRNLAAHVPQFAEGGDFVTNGRQLIMVGDNPSGKERVQITPLGGDPAPNAPSAGVTVNVSGNVLSQDFVEGELAENIKEAIRRGTDFGIATS